MHQISFPEKEYGEYLAKSFDADEPILMNEFNFNAMIVIALNRYCLQLIFYEICGIKFDFKQQYTYSFKPFEIKSLGKKSSEEIIRHKIITTDYDFTLSTFSKNYKGMIKIEVKLDDNFTFESSFYTIEIEFLPEKKLEILPFFLPRNSEIRHYAEFMHMVWKPVHAQLDNIDISARVKSNHIALDNICTVLQNGNLDIFTIPANKRDFISDVFNIVHSMFVGVDPINGRMEISADDVLSVRGLLKNANSKGLRGGYKNHERLKVHQALRALNYLDMLVVTNVSGFNYQISIPHHLRHIPKYNFPKKLVEYNYKTHLWQRRLGFCLRANKTAKIKVQKLFHEIEELCPSLRPAQIRDKFEEVLDYLASDGVIQDWHYEKIDENAMQGKSWIERWKKLHIIYRY